MVQAPLRPEDVPQGLPAVLGHRLHVPGAFVVGGLAAALVGLLTGHGDAVGVAAPGGGVVDGKAGLASQDEESDGSDGGQEVAGGDFEVLEGGGHCVVPCVCGDPDCFPRLGQGRPVGVLGFGPERLFLCSRAVPLD